MKHLLLPLGLCLTVCFVLSSCDKEEDMTPTKTPVTQQHPTVNPGGQTVPD